MSKKKSAFIGAAVIQIRSSKRYGSGREKNRRYSLKELECLGNKETMEIQHIPRFRTTSICSSIPLMSACTLLVPGFLVFLFVAAIAFYTFLFLTPDVMALAVTSAAIKSAKGKLSDIFLELYQANGVYQGLQEHEYPLARIAAKHGNRFGDQEQQNIIGQLKGAGGGGGDGSDYWAILTISDTFVKTLYDEAGVVRQYLLGKYMLQDSTVIRSIRLFAFLHNVPVEKNYRSGPTSRTGDLSLRLFAQLQIRINQEQYHPHTGLMSPEGAVEKCIYYDPTRPYGHPEMVNIDQIRLHSNFTQFLSERANRERVGWPKDWDFRLRPWLPRQVNGRPIKCKQCNLFCDPELPNPAGQDAARCSCVFSRLLPNQSYPGPLVEIFVHRADEDGEYFRGARALQQIQSGTILGEYTGVAVPADSGDDFTRIWDADFAYIYQFPLADEVGVHTCAITANIEGNWTRFMNDPTNKQELLDAADDEVEAIYQKAQDIANVECEIDVYAGRNHVILKARKDIQPMDELLLWYGADYFRPAREAHQKEKIAKATEDAGGPTQDAGGPTRDAGGPTGDAGAPAERKRYARKSRQEPYSRKPSTTRSAKKLLITLPLRPLRNKASLV